MVSPSGAGKTTLSQKLESAHDIGFSVSYTTRQPREGEVDGRDYHFVSDEVFSAMVEDKAFAEWAHVHGAKYGTAIDTVNRAIEQGRDFLFDVDYQGGAQLRNQWPHDSVSVFILPPSMTELERRLRRRGTDADAAIRQRLDTARKEMAHFSEYDYLIVNDDVDRAYEELSAVYVAARCARRRSAPRAQALLSAPGPVG